MREGDAGPVTPTDASLVPDSVADQSARIGLGRLFTSPGVDPYDEVVWERRDARITNWKDGTVAFEQPDVEFPATGRSTPRNIVAQKYFRGTLGTAERESSLRQVIDRVVDTITRWGVEGGYFVDDAEARGVQRRAEVHPRHPAGGVQQPGVVQHRRRRACRSRPRRASSSPSTTRWTRSSTGTGRRASSSRAARAPGINLSRIRSSAELLQRRRHGLRPGELHARRRRLGRHDQVGRQDPARREDGHPRRRPPRHRGVHLVQGARGAQGARPARRTASTWTSTAPTRSRSSTRTPTTRCASPTSSCRRSSTTPTGTSSPSPPARCCARSRPATCGARSPRRRGSAPTPACSSTPRSTAGTRRHTPAGSTAATRAPSTCTSTTRRATWPRSTCSSTSTTTALRRRRLPPHGRDRFTAQEILVGRADYPTAQIAETSRDFRQLGLGYANLGALLMALGLPYDSADGPGLGRRRSRR